MRASEFQSHSKQSEETISSPEEDSANIVKDVIVDVDDEITSDSAAAQPEWENW